MKYFITSVIMLIPFSIYGQKIITANANINIANSKRCHYTAGVGVRNIASINVVLILPHAASARSDSIVRDA